MAGWHHRMQGLWTWETRDGEAQEEPAVLCPQGSKESHTTWQLNNNNNAGLLVQTLKILILF